MRKSEDEYYYPPQHFESADGNIVATVYRPILEPEERHRREERVKKAAENILRPLLFPEFYAKKEKGDTKD